MAETANGTAGRMGVLDRFGGPQAWDIHCAAQDAALAALKRANPSCGTCENGIVCPDCGLAYCKETCEWGDNFAPPCEYEGWVQK